MFIFGWTVPVWPHLDSYGNVFVCLRGKRVATLNHIGVRVCLWATGGWWWGWRRWWWLNWQAEEESLVSVAVSHTPLCFCEVATLILTTNEVCVHFFHIFASHQSLQWHRLRKKLAVRLVTALKWSMLSLKMLQTSAVLPVWDRK